MYSALHDVADFHKACDVPIAALPSIPSLERVQLRFRLIDEEVNKELFPALVAAHDPERVQSNYELLNTIADGIADSIYVLIGTALEFGIPLDSIWDAVQEANMAKVDKKTGKVIRRPDGKILKPEGWSPPDIAYIIKRAMDRPRKY